MIAWVGRFDVIYSTSWCTVRSFASSIISPIASAAASASGLGIRTSTRICVSVDVVGAMTGFCNFVNRFFFVVCRGFFGIKRRLILLIYGRFCPDNCCKKRRPVSWKGGIPIQSSANFGSQALSYMMNENLLIKKITFSKVSKSSAD